MVLNTFKTTAQIYNEVPLFIFKPTWNNYRFVLGSDLFRGSFVLSIAMTASSTFLTLLIGTMAGYAFSRFHFRGKNDIMLLILLTRMIPPIVIVIPIFYIYVNIGLQDTFLGLLLVFANINLAFSVWIMKGYFDGIPTTIEEAAMCDGYSRFHGFIKLIVPMVIPGILATAVFCGIFIWNEFLFSSVLTWNNISLMTPKIYTTSGGAGSVSLTISLLYSLPMIVFTFLIRKQLLRGISFGILKN
jgi:multiple sugar transport system permease protein